MAQVSAATESVLFLFKLSVTFISLTPFDNVECIFNAPTLVIQSNNAGCRKLDRVEFVGQIPIPFFINFSFSHHKAKDVVSLYSHLRVLVRFSVEEGYCGFVAGVYCSVWLGAW